MNRYQKFKKECKDWSIPLLVLSIFVVPIAFSWTNWALRPIPPKPLPPTDKELEIEETKRLEVKSEKEKKNAWHRANGEEFEQERIRLFAYCHQEEMRFCNDLVDKNASYLFVEKYYN